MAAVTAPKAPPKPLGPRSWKSDGITFPSLGDKTRDACRNLVYDALAINSGARTYLAVAECSSLIFRLASDLIVSRSTAVEEAVFNNCGQDSNADYRTKMRSLYLNLKGKENPSLREGVVSGDIPAKQLAVMSSAEMASEERKQKDKTLQEENLFKSLGVGEQQAETDAFQCGRCKQVCTSAIWPTEHLRNETSARQCIAKLRLVLQTNL